MVEKLPFPNQNNFIQYAGSLKPQQNSLSFLNIGPVRNFEISIPKTPFMFFRTREDL